MKKAIETCSHDQCLRQERRDSIAQFTYTADEILAVNNEITKICRKFQEKKNPEKFVSSFLVEITSKVILFFPKYSQVSSSTLMMQLGEDIFCYMKKPESIEKTPTPISEKEMGGLNYLAGYVIRKLLKKTRNSPKYKTVESQEIIVFLESAIEKNGTNDLINTLDRGGLTTVTEDCLRIFYLAEEEFRKSTEIVRLRKIDIGKITENLMDNPDVISLFAAVADGINIQNVVKQNIQQKILQLYLRVRSFSLAKDVTTKQRKEHKEARKNKGLRKQIKNSMEQTDSHLAI